jgi:hypothetical protein
MCVSDLIQATLSRKGRIIIMFCYNVVIITYYSFLVHLTTLSVASVQIIGCQMIGCLYTNIRYPRDMAQIICHDCR